MKKANYRIGFLGCGNMAEAFIRGILRAKLCKSSDIVVSDVRRDRCKHIALACGAKAAGNNAECAASSGLVFIAVKPQNLKEVLRDLSSVDLGGKTIISIVAGGATGQIEEGLGGSPPVVRVMPNTPALIGEGVSVWTCGRFAGEGDRLRVRSVLRAVGTEFEVSEELMDAATALSGSGPAYVYYLMEAMIAAGERLGFTRDQASGMAIGTVAGASSLARKALKTPAELRRQVTSPGGTTAAAMELLEKNGVRKSIISAINAACKRAGELGNKA